MKKWIWLCSTLLGLCLVVGNLYLYQKYNDKVYHVTKITNFNNPVEGDIRISYINKGVVTSNEENVIMYQRQLGIVGEILVSEGDQVQVGTKLLQYNTDDSEELMYQLESKITRALAESTKIRKDISALRSVRFPTVFESEWEEAQTEANQVLIDSQIRELELKEELLEMDIEDDQLQLQKLESDIESKTVVSTTEGIVKTINKNGNDELITIITYPYVIKGELSESDLENIEIGQKVYVSQGEKPIIGTVQEISQFPVKSPSLHEETSYFPFTISVQEENKLLFGHHVGVEIVKKESIDTIIIPANSVTKNKFKDSSVYILEQGKAKKVEIQLGIQSDSRVEVVNGINENVLLVTAPDKKIKADIPFIMPVQNLVGSSSQLNKVEKKEATSTVLRAIITK
jgi:HlyD family secretion protein